MKKVLVLLVMLFTISLVACDNDTTTVLTTNEYEVLQNEVNSLESEIQAQIDALELQIALLQERIDNLVSVEGLNGQTIWYESQIQMLSETIDTLESSFDDTKAPSYMVDENGDYIELEDLAYMLKEKYYNKYRHGSDVFKMGDQLYLRYHFTSDMTQDEVFARTVLLIEEMQNYEFYVLSCTELVIHIYNYDDNSEDHQIKIYIPLTVLINDMFDLTLESIYNEQYEATVELSPNTILDYETTLTFYDSFVDSGVFSGYVLDFE